MRAKRAQAIERTPALVLGDLCLLRPIALADIPAMVVATDPRAPALRSRHAKTSLIVPPLAPPTEEHALDALIDAARAAARRTGRPPLLLYGSDAVLAFIYRHRQAVESAFAVLLNPPALAESLFDKQRFHRHALGAGVRVPDTLGDDEPLAAAARLGDAIVIKPRTKEAKDDVGRALFGEAKARVVSRRELADVARHRHRLVIQERVPGEVADLVSFHGFNDERGRLLAWFAGRKIRTQPESGGDSAYIELIDDAKVVAVGREVARRLGLVGVFKIDLLRHAGSGDYVTLEVNSRFNLWHYLGAVHGVNLPLVAYRHLVEGRAAEPCAYRPSRRWIDLYRDHEAMKGSGLPLGAWLWSIARAPKIYETFAWDDPLPALVWLGDALGARLKKRWHPWRESA